MTASLILLSPGEAQRLTQRIKLTASSVRDGMFKLRNLVEEAKRSNVWQVLGYQSWTAYLADTLADEPMRLGRDERQELVGYLAGEGLSTRAIAPIVGVDRKTIERDIRGGTNVPPAPGSPVEKSITVAPVTPGEPVAARVDEAPTSPRAVTKLPHMTDEDAAAFNAITVDEAGAFFATDPLPNDAPSVNWEAATVPVREITGLDGKTYTTKAPTERRTSILDDARNAAWQLRKAIERLERIKTDDRFTKNKAEIMAALQPHLDFANEVLADL